MTILRIKSKIRIALICGGSSPERRISIDGGKQVYSAINKKKYDVIVYDPVNDILKLVKDASNGKIDFAFVVLHGCCGEDGSIHGLLNILGIPHQGSSLLGSAIAMNKIASKYMFEQAGIPVAPYVVLNEEDLHFGRSSTLIESRLEFPVIIKPAETGSSFGASVVKQVEDVDTSLFEALKYGNSILVESYIKGTELTCGILGNNDLRALPLVEIVFNSSFFDYDSKYGKNLAQEICPARINDDLTKKAQVYAKKAHNALFCKGYSRTDMILKDDNFYVLETNTIPGMTSDSLYPKSAICDGISFENMVEELISLGFENDSRRQKENY